jgi:branched-chain amino acid transport system substrate-binding protein
VKRRFQLGTAIAVLGVLAVLAAGCGGGGSKSTSGGGEANGKAKALPSAACAQVKFGLNGTPDYIIASDLPEQGAGRAQITQMEQAIEYILKQHGWKAGKYFIGYQACDDSTAATGGWDSAKCSANAKNYANNTTVIGVIGTFNSGCAKLIIPVLNRASDGPVAQISPANTYPGLTIGGPGTEAGEPGVYYPTGTRNYARVVWTDQFQGAADALYAQQLKLKNVYVLNDGQTYGNGVATLFKEDLGKLGIKVAGFQKWDAKATSYDSIASKIKSSGADGVFLGGIICNNGGKLIKDLRAGVGSNVTIIAPDGFTPFSAVTDGAGSAANGMYISAPGIPVQKLPDKTFAQSFGAEIGGAEVTPYSAYAAQAAAILMDTIASSNGTRADVAEKLFPRTVNKGILGNFKLDDNGDTTLGTVTINQITGGTAKKNSKVVTTITPKTSFVKGS